MPDRPAVAGPRQPAPRCVRARRFSSWSQDLASHNFQSTGRLIFHASQLHLFYLVNRLVGSYGREATSSILFEIGLPVGPSQYVSGRRGAYCGVVHLFSLGCPVRRPDPAWRRTRPRTRRSRCRRVAIIALPSRTPQPSNPPPGSGRAVSQRRLILRVCAARRLMGARYPSARMRRPPNLSLPRWPRVSRGVESYLTKNCGVVGATAPQVGCFVDGSRDLGISYCSHYMNQNMSTLRRSGAFVTVALPCWVDT
jgi:hypothetical protein